MMHFIVMFIAVVAIDVVYMLQYKYSAGSWDIWYLVRIIVVGLVLGGLIIFGQSLTCM